MYLSNSKTICLLLVLIFIITELSQCAAPIVKISIPNVVWSIVDTSSTTTTFTALIPPSSDTFYDADGDVLTYSVTRRDGTALPSFMSWSNGVYILKGTSVTTAHSGTYALKVTASDGTGSSVSADFNVIVNRIPVVTVTSLPSQTGTLMTAWTYTVPSTTFSDSDTGQVLTYSAVRSGSSTLPAWLKFTPSTRTFSGTPGLSDSQTYTIVVTATDPYGASASTSFTLSLACPAVYSRCSFHNAIQLYGGRFITLPCGNVYAGNSVFTTQIWIRPKVYSCSIIQTSASKSIMALNSVGQIVFSTYSANSVTATATIPLNYWTQVSVVKNGANWAIYYNGTSMLPQEHSLELHVLLTMALLV